MKQVTHNVHYWTYGNPKHQPLFLVHGFTGSHEGFQYIVPKLKHFFVIVPDLPGFGESPLDFEPWTTEGLASRVNAFVRELKLKQPPILVSHSLGGLVAASMLDQNPELFVHKTIFISPVATKIGIFDSRRIGALFGNLQYLVGKKTGRFGDKLVKNRTLSRIATAVIMTEKNKSMQATIYNHHFKNLDYISSIDFYHKLYRDIVNRGAVDYASSLKKFEVLLIASDKDNVTPLPGERLLAKTIGAKLDIIPGVGHLTHYEKPAEIVALMNDFLK